MCVQPILLTEKQVAEATGFTVRTLYTFRKRGYLPFVRVGTHIRYRVCDVEALAERFLITESNQGQDGDKSSLSSRAAD